MRLVQIEFFLLEVLIFQSWLPAYKFQVFFTIIMNSLNLSKVLYDTIEINYVKFNKLWYFKILYRIIFIC